MGFAANMWVNENNWKGQYCLNGIEIGGADFKVTQFIEIS